jgi:hypothetical protein
MQWYSRKKSRQFRTIQGDPETCPDIGFFGLALRRTGDGGQHVCANQPGAVGRSQSQSWLCDNSTLRQRILV